MNDRTTAASTMMSWAGAIMAGAVALAFLAAWGLHEQGLLSLVPPPSDAMPNPAPDVAPGNTLSLYQAAFTAWAALILLIPTYVAFWFRFRSARARSIWLAFWAMGAVAYLIHLAISMFGFFGGDFGAMTSSTRVSAFWPGMIIAIWWPLDALLALRRTENATWITIQRVVLHLVVLILFVGGSAAKGELMLVRTIGVVLFAATLGGGIVWLLGRKRAI